MLDLPRNKQIVLIRMLNGARHQARFYQRLVATGGPGYEFRTDEGHYFCSADEVATWLDDSANDPLGYDLSMEGTGP